MSSPGPLFPPNGRVPPIRSGLVYLRPGERSDIPVFVRWMNDVRTTRTLLMSSPISDAMEERWFDQMLEHHGRDRWFFVICRIADDRAVGSIDLHEVDLRNGTARLGIVIGDPADTGQGYGSDGAPGAARLRLRPAPAGADRARGLRLQRAAPGGCTSGSGSSTRGRAATRLYRDGAFHDVHRMAILREEWTTQARERGSAG